MHVTKKTTLKEALSHELWKNHKIAYYPLLESGKTGEVYEEARALVETPIKGGIDLREVPLRYLTKII